MNLKRRKSAKRTALFVCFALVFILLLSSVFMHMSVYAEEHESITVEEETQSPAEETADQPAEEEFLAPESGESSEYLDGEQEETTEEVRTEEELEQELTEEAEEVLLEESLEEAINETNEEKTDEVKLQEENQAEDSSLQASTVTRKVGYVAVSGLNIRKGAGTGYQAIGTVGTGTVVIRSQKKDSAGTVWYKIRHHGTTGYICSESGGTKYVTNIKTVKVDTSQVAQFPDSYREALIDLLAVNPHYVFKMDEIDYSLEEAAQWHVGVKVDPDYSWSSYATIYKYMDPLYYMDPQGIFAFAEQTYNSTQKEAGLISLFSAGNAFLNTASYRKALLEAGKDNGVSPYVLAATIIAEKGWHADEDGISAVVGWQVWKGTVTKNQLAVRSGAGTGYGIVDYLNKGTVYIAGTETASNGVKWYRVIRSNGYAGYVSSNYVSNVAKYKKYYNFFSINQTDDNSDIGGIFYAMKKGWDTQIKSIKGGAVFYKDGYINNGQDTYYYKDFNVINPQSNWWHEYAGAVHAPAASALLLSYAYTDDTTSKVVFRIPVYKGTAQTGSPTGLTLNKSELALLPKKTANLSASVQPSNATDTSVVWKSSNTAAATVNSSGKVTAVGPGTAVITASAKADSSVKATCKVTTQFYDVTKASAYYYDAVYWAHKKGIAGGYSNLKFGIGDNCTRKQMILFLWKTAGKPAVSGTMPFKDVNYKKSTDSYKAILWGAKKGIIRGYSDGTFRPDRPVSRSAAMVMLYRIAGKPSVSGKNPFSDMQKKSSSSDSYKATLWAYKKGIAGGYKNGRFGIRDACRREHIVTFIYRYKTGK